MPALESRPPSSPLDDLMRGPVDGLLTVGDVGAMLNVSPRLLTQLLYTRVLPTDQCLLRNGRRWIPVSMLGEIREILVDRGYLAAQ